jgi:4-aminobutyrate aminotransferase
MRALAHFAKRTPARGPATTIAVSRAQLTIATEHETGSTWQSLPGKGKAHRPLPRPPASAIDSPPCERYVSAREHLAHGLASPLCESEVSHALGSWVYTREGNKLLDFTSGIGVTNVGHCHPTVVKATKAQLGKLFHTSMVTGLPESVISLTHKLVGGILPAALNQVMYSTTGAEAVENAMRIARAATSKSNMIVFQGAYHGRTNATLSLTRSKTAYGVRNVPQMSGVYVAPFPYETQSPGVGADACLFQLELLLKQQTAPEDTAAMIIEPVLGEGGYVPAPAAFLRGLRKLCDKHGIMLIFDEVQTGYGRTGKMWALEHALVVPDIMCMGKGIASGFPLAAVACSTEVSRHSPPGTLGGTYAGNPIGCTAALATLRVFEEEGVLANACARGEQLCAALEAVRVRHPQLVKEIRGLGLMIGVELTSRVPHGTAKALSARCAKEGLLLLTAGTFETMRFIPPLTVSRDEIEEGVRLFERALVATCGE